MNLTLTIFPGCITIDKEIISKDLAEEIATHSVVIDSTIPNKLVVDFDPRKAFLLPTKATFDNWKLITRVKKKTR